MLWFITIALAMVSVALFLHVLRLRRLLGELDNAVRSRRRLLLKESADSIRRMGALRLVDSLNGVLDLDNKTAADKTVYLS